jgi:hypothetical protein
MKKALQNSKAAAPAISRDVFLIVASRFIIISIDLLYIGPSSTLFLNACQEDFEPGEALGGIWRKGPRSSAASSL